MVSAFAIQDMKEKKVKNRFSVFRWLGVVNEDRLSSLWRTQ